MRDDTPALGAQEVSSSNLGAPTNYNRYFTAAAAGINAMCMGIQKTKRSRLDLN